MIFVSRFALPLLILGLAAPPLKSAQASVTDLLRGSAGLRAALLETEAGTEVLSLTLGRPIRPGSGNNLRERSSEVLEEALALWRNPSIPASKALEDQLERTLRSLSRDSELAGLEARLEASGLTAAERQELEQRLRVHLEERLQRQGGFGLSGVPEVREFFARQSLEKAGFLGTSGQKVHRSHAQHRDEFLKPSVNVSERAAGPAHEAITTDLFNGEVISSRSMSENGNFNTIFKVVLRNPRTGRYREAVFKPRTAGDGNGWNRVPMEYVAYELNRMLGMDYVPPVAYRYGLKLAGYQFQEGALIHFVPNSSVLGELAADALPLSRAAIASDSRVLSVLLQNTDAHAKNLLAGPHWADGVVRPVFIDFGASLRSGANISLTRGRASGNDDPIFWVRESTLNRLRALDRATLDRAIGPFTTAEEISGILRRRDELVAEFDRLRRTYGDAAILLGE